MRTMAERNGPTFGSRWDHSGNFYSNFNECGAPKGGAPSQRLQSLSKKWDQKRSRNSLRNFQFGPTVHHAIRVALLATAILISPAVYAGSTHAAVPHQAMMQIGQGRPAGCPRLWCGCFLSKVFGVHIWRAIDWRNWGHPAPAGAVGSVAVMRGHVGLVADGKCGPGQIKLLSGNSSHRVRLACYPRSRVIAWRQPGKASAYAVPARQSREGGR